MKKVNNLPKSSGIYKFINSEGVVIYIGKAKNLKSRVNSYFNTGIDKLSKTGILVSQIADLEYIETISELEALILEAELIKKHRPKYNIVLKDDKSYLYIVIRNEKVEINGKKVKLPKILSVRATDVYEDDIVFGPYPNTNTARYILRTIRRIFPYRDCSVSKFNRYKRINRPCLYGYIGVCQAPCVGRITPQKYRTEIKRIESLLSGESSKITWDLERKMKAASKNQDFEKAAWYRDILEKFKYVRNTTRSPESYIENPYLVQDIREKSLQELSDNIEILSDIPERIECYDISNLSGTDAVGSMVVALDGVIQNSEYRRFKIKRKKTPDDFDMMNEVLGRRLKREISTVHKVKKWGMPDLIVVDGGKGQVSAAIKVLDKLNLNIPVIGLAKKHEIIVYFYNEEFVELELPRDNEGLKLLQRLRNEAHRFAQAYHHKLRLNRI